MMTDVELGTLESSFHELFSALSLPSGGSGVAEVDYSSISRERWVHWMRLIEFCREKVHTESIYSKNEELDDINTESLKVHILHIIVMP